MLLLLLISSLIVSSQNEDPEKKQKKRKKNDHIVIVDTVTVAIREPDPIYIQQIIIKEELDSLMEILLVKKNNNKH